jgi:hypothetical protein
MVVYPSQIRGLLYRILPPLRMEESAKEDLCRRSQGEHQFERRFYVRSKDLFDKRRANMSGLDGLGWPAEYDFSEMPLPWTYREDTRDVVASNGTVVCKAGDTVADGYRSGPLIVALANAQAKDGPTPRKEDCVDRSYTLIEMAAWMDMHGVAMHKWANDMRVAAKGLRRLANAGGEGWKPAAEKEA